MKRALCILLALLLLPLPAVFAEGAEDVWSIPKDRPAERLTDSDVMTRITVPMGQSIRLHLQKTGGTLYLAWYEIPKSPALLKQFDADGTVLSTDPVGKEGEYYVSVPLSEQCAALSLEAKNAAYTVSTLFVSADAPDPAYGFFASAPEKADLLLVLASPKYEFEALSGLLADYTVEHGVATAIVYLCPGRRYVQHESRLALESLGIHTSPIYLNCTDHEFNRLDDVQKCWDPTKPVEQLTELFAALQPKVVVTMGAAHDDVRVTYTNTLVKLAAEGRKLNLFETDPAGKTVLDFTAPLVTFDGQSAVSAATKAYAFLESQRMFQRTLSERLTLSRTDGKSAASLFAGIDSQTLISYQAPTPTLVPTDTPTPTDSPSPAPAAKPTEAPTAEIVAAKASDSPTEAPSAPTEAPKQRTGLFSCAAKEEPKPQTTETPKAAQTTLQPSPKPEENPTETSTIAPTDPPEPTPTPVPTPTPIPEFDTHFLNDGSGEFVSTDLENGEWIYRSEILAVEIHRRETTCVHGGKKEPCVYYVADIYERGADSFRPTFGTEQHDGRVVATAQEMSDRAKCVLWITGDNLINSDPEIKSILIRDGYLFRQATGFDCMVLDAKTHSIRIVPAKSITAEDLLESGVMNSFSFGPTMIVDGAVVERAKSQRRTINPRTVLGMVEPGHLVSVVVDGRQPGYSMGMTMSELIELMESLGCTVAYNLDGGMSATMMFLGAKVNRHGEGIDPVSGNPNTLRQMPDGLSWGYSERYYGTVPASEP